MPVLILALAPSLTNAYFTGLLMGENSVAIHHIKDENPVIWRETMQSYLVMYSNEPDPSNFLFQTDLEFPNMVWSFGEAQNITPKVTAFYMDFMDSGHTGSALGAIYRLPASESRNFETIADLTAAPLTIIGHATYLWNFNTRINYYLATDVELNLGYRNIVVKMKDHPRQGFEKGIYIGMTTYFE